MQLPTCTYRIQLNDSFGFKEIKKHISYLNNLGISAVYASPVFKSQKGSTHGYDICDYNALNPEIGNEQELKELINDLKRKNILWIQDFVPNHMAYNHNNRWLYDVLEKGETSQYYHFFDFLNYETGLKDRNKLLAPVLGSPREQCLARGEIKLRLSGIGFQLVYHDHVFPVCLSTYEYMFSENPFLEIPVKDQLHEKIHKIRALINHIRTMIKNKENHKLFTELKKTIWSWYNEDPVFKKFISQRIKTANKSSKEEYDRHLDHILNVQHYLLSYWKTANTSVNYRRFFTINGLICMRNEDDEVFEHIHEYLFHLIQSNLISGVRIDHIDGLYDPEKYLKKLFDKMGDKYLIVEKILESSETLSKNWKAHGTTGYDFMNKVNLLFFNPAGNRVLQGFYKKISNKKIPSIDLIAKNKKIILDNDMQGELDYLTQLAIKQIWKSPGAIDMSYHDVKNCLSVLLIYFPIYRSYCNSRDSKEHDTDYIEQAFQISMKNYPGYLHVFQYIKKELFTISEYPKDPEKAFFISRFQQFTGPLMAKGFEDTLLYSYNKLLSLNEVGGDPFAEGIDTEQFHDFILKRRKNFPYSMNATSTHDVKRGEDVRARINVLSEISTEWIEHFKHWRKLNKKFSIHKNGTRIPDKSTEYAIYQTLIGTMPWNQKINTAYRERIKGYMIKAGREAKLHTSWNQPDQEYEQGTLAFVDAILNPAKNPVFLNDFLPFQRKISFYGLYNSLSQTLLKFTCPGIPDIYQGTEAWDLNLVDPDNRGIVQFETLDKLLKDVHKRSFKDQTALLEFLQKKPESGQIKIFLINKILQMRNSYKVLFDYGDYIPLQTEGKHKDHIISFARAYENNVIIVIVPRWLAGIINEGTFTYGHDVWEDTRVVLNKNIENSDWLNIFTSDKTHYKNQVLVSQAISSFPVSVLFKSLS